MSKLITDEALRSKLKAMSSSDIHRAILLAYEEEIADLLAAAQRQLLTELLGELPKKSTLETVEEESQEYADGKDDAIDQVVSIIEHYLTKAEPEQGEKG